MISIMNLFSSLIWFCWIIGTLVLLYAIKYLSNFIGYFGEFYVKKELNKLPSDKYTIYNNIMIEIEGVTHQIDHIVTSPYGIFVIETKQYSGYYVGSRFSKYWQSYYGKKKYQVHNPIRQNYGHILALSELMGIDVNYFYNIVCLSGIGRYRIYNGYELCGINNLIKRITKYNNAVFRDTSTINRIIEVANITDWYIRREHVKRLRSRYGK